MDFFFSNPLSGFLRGLTLDFQHRGLAVITKPSSYVVGFMVGPKVIHKLVLQKGKLRHRAVKCLFQSYTDYGYPILKKAALKHMLLLALPEMNQI